MGKNIKKIKKQETVNGKFEMNRILLRPVQTISLRKICPLLGAIKSVDVYVSGHNSTTVMIKANLTEPFLYYPDILALERRFD